MRNAAWLLISAAALALGPAACAPESDAPAPRLGAFVCLLPQAWFVQRIGGPRVQVDTLVAPGQSPHTYEPTPRQIARLAQAQVYFSVGFPFEKLLLEKVTADNPHLRVVDSRAGVKLRYFTDEEAAHEEAEHGAERDHHHSNNEDAREPDPHFWLSPRDASIMAANIAKGLEEVDPGHAAEYQDRLRSLQADLDQTDAALAKALAPLKGRPLFVYHPAFGYFADAYGLKQVAVEIEGKEPSARQLAALIDRARREGARVIFVQPQFSAKSADAVAKTLGGVVVPMDDLAPDYLANLNDMAAKIQKALAGTP
jgi:zinc transport system substrate-binding protein